MHGDSFRGSGKILLIEGDALGTFKFQITQCSSATSNDGFLPYLVNIDTTSAYNNVETVEDSTSSGVVINSFGFDTDNTVNVRLSYAASGRWGIDITMGLSDGSIKHAVFDRIFCESVSG